MRRAMHRQIDTKPRRDTPSKKQKNTDDDFVKFTFGADD